MPPHSEIVIRVNPETSVNPLGYHDQDASIVYNGRDISEHHIKRILDHRSDAAARSSVTNLLVLGTHFEDFFIQTHENRFRRVGFDACERFNLRTREAKIVTSIPDTDGEFMKVSEYVNKRRRRKDHRLFGDNGSEVWYGGHQDFSNAVLNRLWGIIQGSTSERRIDNEFYPYSINEFRKNLILPFEDMTDAEKESLLESDYDDPSDLIGREMTRKRKRKIVFRDLSLGVEIEDVENRSKKVDVRGRTPFTRSEGVENKPPVVVPLLFLNAMAARATRRGDGV